MDVALFGTIDGPTDAAGPVGSVESGRGRRRLGTRCLSAFISFFGQLPLVHDLQHLLQGRGALWVVLGRSAGGRRPGRRDDDELFRHTVNETRTSDVSV